MADLMKMNDHMMGWLKEITPFIEDALQKELDIDTKSNHRDLVSNIDKEVEAFLTAKITQTYPGHHIIGEENAQSVKTQTAGKIWIIDPIDGTTNFVKQKDNFCILIAYYEQGVGKIGHIYDVLNRNMYYAIDQQGAYLNGKPLQAPPPIKLSDGLVSCDVRNWYDKSQFQHLVDHCFDIRYYGCGGIDSIHVFNGKITAFITSRSGPWDAAAPLIIAEELGLTMVRLDGFPVDYLTGGGFVLANPGSIDDILAIMKHDHGLNSGN